MYFISAALIIIIIIIIIISIISINLGHTVTVLCKQEGRGFNFR
jgi:hypothetical protein